MVSPKQCTAAQVLAWHKQAAGFNHGVSEENTGAEVCDGNNDND